MEPNNDDLEKKVDRILFYLQNDDGTGRKGLVAEFHDHKEKVNDFMAKYETQQEIKRTKLTIWGAVGGSIISTLVFLFKWLAGDSN